MTTSTTGPATSRGRRRAPVLPVLGLLLTVALTACGSADDDVSAASTSGSGDNDSSSAEDGELAFYDCMRENGIDLPDPDPNQEGVQLDMSAIDPDDPASKAALEECEQLLPGGGEPPEQDAESLAALREFTECLRENGIDMPDPGADGALSMPQGVDPNSAEFQAAMDECQDLIAGERMIMRGGQ